MLILRHQHQQKQVWRLPRATVLTIRLTELRNMLLTPNHIHKSQGIDLESTGGLTEMEDIIESIRLLVCAPD